MTITLCSPTEAQKLREQGLLMIDIRSPAEFNRQHIAQAQLIASEDLLTKADALRQHPGVIFYCSSGMRTKHQQALLAQLNHPHSYILAGGLRAWRKAGLPVVKDHAMLPIMQQVQFVTGLFVTLGVSLGFLLNSSFLLLALVVGVGLMFAGLTGFCGLAIVLMKMPWNKNNR